MEYHILKLSRKCSFKFFPILLMFILSSFTVLAQQSVKGKVTDVQGEPLIGVSIVVPGTSSGTMTDLDGNYTLSVPSGKNQLNFSYVGYKDQTVNIGGKSVINVTMTDDSKMLGEVVAVGYGTQKKVNLTAAVASIGGDAFENKGVVSNPLQALQGEVPGLTVTRTSSAPGREGWKFNIRGASSINETNALVIIDGVPGSMDNINPNDVESMSVLKDGAAAIYGARAAAGVVLVTTKKGNNKKTTVTYNGNVEFKKPGLMMDYMGMQHYMYTFEEAYLNDGTANPDGDLNIYPRFVVDAYKSLDPQYMNSYVQYIKGDIHDYGFYDVDWRDVLWQTAVSNSHSISIRGGADKYTYNLSVGYMNDQSVLNSDWGTDKSQRYNIRSNNTYNLNDRVRLTANLSFERRNTVYPQRKPNDIGGQPAGSPVSTDEGLPYAWGGQLGSHWQAKLGGEVNNLTNSFTGNLGLEVDLYKGLKLIANAAFNPSDNDKEWWENKIDWYYLNGDFNQINPSTDKMGRESRTSLYQNYTGFLEYKETFGDHGIGAMLGTSFEKNTTTWFESVVGDLITESIHSNKTGTKTLSQRDDTKEWALASYFGRLNYSYKDRYLAEFVGRYDGSSRFTSDNRWKGFAGGSAAWRISEEDFMKSNGIFDNLKLRFSYGQTGNQAGINEYDFIPLLNINSPGGQRPNQPIFGPDSGPKAGQTITQANTVSYDRTWERITTTDFGFDIAVLNNRLSGYFDYYIKRNDNMLAVVTYPQVFGAIAPKTNSADLKTKGWEVALNWKDKIGDVAYNVGFNLSDSKNELLKMENAITKAPGYNATVEGYPIGSYFGYSANKLIETQEELAAYKSNCTLPGSGSVRIGDMMYNDTDGDGKVTPDDLVHMGDVSPHLMFGIKLGASWNGFDLSAMFQGVGKQVIFRDSGLRGPMTAWYQRQNDAWFGEAYSDIAEIYPGYDLMPVNKSPGALPKLSANGTINDYNYQYSDAWYRKMNGKYMRLKNLVIGYTIPQAITSKAGIEKLRVYFSGNDLFEFQKIKDGWDPEASRDITGGTIGSNMYPFARTYAFGIDLTF